MAVRLSGLRVPDGIEIRRCPHGYGSFTKSNAFFSVGARIDVIRYKVFPSKEAAPFCTLPIPNTKLYFGYLCEWETEA